MRRNMISLMLLFCLVACLTVGCAQENGTSGPAPLTPIPIPTNGGQNPMNDETNPTPTPFMPIRERVTYPMTRDNVKVLGRTCMIDEVRWCGFSGSGVEFFFAGTECSVNLRGDDMTESTGHNARVAIYVDGVRQQDIMINENDVADRTVEIIKSDIDTIATIRIVKLSEVSDSTFGIVSVDAVGMISPLVATEKKIEFIGDSITCGYGVDGVLGEDVYQTSNEDCTKAYAYKTAELLGMDYSLVSMSGYGIVSGYTGDGVKNPGQTLPQYYKTLGNCYGHFAGTVAPSSVAWDFSEFVPDYVVINLGTNDFSYCGADEERRREYIEGYKEFLKVVRECNPYAKIVCVLGIMGTDLCGSMETAVAEYSAENGDNYITTMRFTEQDQALDGIAVDWHPSDKTHTKAAKKLALFLKEQ